MEQNIEKLQAIVSPLLTWYDENRRILPWREEVSAYRTWVSEIMLQQTRVAAVLPYFQRFMARYPTVQDLARGDEEELLKLWEGLGYYSRARNLQKAARIVAEDYAGAFPADYKELIALPGIGDYTAGAILSIAFGLPVPAVDGNVLRIASRITGWDRDVQSTKKEITRWMTEVVPSDRPGAFNQALMDLGSALCLPAAPRCPDCPLRGLCTAEREGSQARIPVRAPKKDKRPEEKTVFLLRRPDGAVALGQRRPGGGYIAAGIYNKAHIFFRHTRQQRLPVAVKALVVIVGVGVKQHGSVPIQLRLGDALVLDGPQALHVLLLHVYALVLVGVPGLQQEDLVLILAGEIVVVPQAALLPANGRENALLHHTAQKFLPPSGLCKVIHR